MTRRVVRAVILACGTAALAAAPTAAQPTTSAPGTGVPNATWVGIFFRGYDAAAQAAGLAPLRSTPLPAGEREVRLWTGGSLGYPRHLYRVRTREGRVVEGELIDYWEMDRDQTKPDSTRYEALIRYHEAGRCGAVTTASGMEACRVLFTRAPDWAGVLARADSAGLWTLRDESELPQRIYIDGWSMTVELRDGAGYRTYHYGNPREDSSHTEYGRALRIVRAFRQADSLARTPDVLRVYRGLYASGPRLSEFRPCGEDVAWHMDGDLRGLPYASSGRPRADTTVVGVRRVYVEVRGMLAPAWLARQWRSEYPRILTVREVLSWREWDPALCRS
jgi:hypothetical protein